MGLPSDLFAATAPPGADERTRLATSAWGKVARLFLLQKESRDSIAQELGLIASDLIALFQMEPGSGVSQRALSEHWSCDPSWVTHRIDRLEELGLVERRLSPTDRRVKEVWLTPSGDRVRNQGIDGFGRPPAPLTDLSIKDLRQLSELLNKLDLPE